MQVSECSECEEVIDAICSLNWEGLTQDDLLDAATGYYYFSIQFRENLKVARELYPDDEKLCQLEAAECDTDNLSPWPGAAQAGEKMDHDEFVRRLLALSPMDVDRRGMLDLLGQEYLRITRGLAPETRAGSIASYEDGGLERVFRAMLRAPHWENPALQAFRHFLVEHIRFDSDAEQGHGALSRHLRPVDSEVSALWLEFKQILIRSAPNLVKKATLDDTAGDVWSLAGSNSIC